MRNQCDYEIPLANVPNPRMSIPHPTFQIPHSPFPIKKPSPLNGFHPAEGVGRVKG